MSLPRAQKGTTRKSFKLLILGLSSTIYLWPRRGRKLENELVTLTWMVEVDSVRKRKQRSHFITDCEIWGQSHSSWKSRQDSGMLQRLWMELLSFAYTTASVLLIRAVPGVWVQRQTWGLSPWNGSKFSNGRRLTGKTTPPSPPPPLFHKAVRLHIERHGFSYAITYVSQEVEFIEGNTFYNQRRLGLAGGSC